MRHKDSRQRAQKMFKNVRTTTKKFSKAKDHLEDRKLSQATRNFLIYRRHEKTENDSSQKIKIRMKKIRRDVEELHKKFYQIAVINDQWSKEMNEIFFAVNKNLLKMVKNLIEDNIALKDERDWYKRQLTRTTSSINDDANDDDDDEKNDEENENLDDDEE